MSLEILKEQLLERWLQAFDEINLLDEFETKAVLIKHAPSSRFGIEGFDGVKIKAGGKFYKEPPADPLENYHEYGIDEKGLPCYSKSWHRHNGIEWKGFYSYKVGLAEYVEYCLNTRVPSGVQRMVLENGRKVLFQRMRMNGGASGSSYIGKSKQEILDELRNFEDYTLICTIEEYEYKDGRIANANCLTVSPGLGQFGYRDAYSYNEKGKLEQVKGVFEDGRSSIRYAVPDKKIKFKELSEILSQKMAHSIVEQILRLGIDEPIATVELSYQYVGSYHPSLSYQTLVEKHEVLKTATEDVFTNLFIKVGHFTYLTDEGFEKDFQQFVQIMEEGERWEAGRKMLRRTSAILTQTKLEGRVSVSDDFVAYAIDWSIEHGGFEKILKDCGLDEAVVKDWKKKGWIPKD